MDIKQFINDKFGSVRVIDNDGSEWFVGNDVAKCLGYSDTEQAIRKHVDEEYKKIFRGNDSLPLKINNRGMTVINESGVYQLIFGSKLPDAKEFQKWVFEEFPIITTENSIMEIVERLSNMTEMKLER